MAKILCAVTADNHFNIPKRSEEAKRILYWMMEDWKTRGVHLIGIAGDLADGPMTERDRAWLIEFIAACSEVAITLVIEGNHDSALSLRNAVGRLKGKYPVIVEDKAGVHVVETGAGRIAIPCVSFPSKAELLAAVGRPVSGEEVEEIAGQALQDVFRGLGVKVKELGLPTLALVHGTIRGSKIAEDQPDRPMGLDMDLPSLALMNADLTVCGHVHLQQGFDFNNRSFLVPGSPFFADFGESKYQKGYILAEFEEVFDKAEERLDKGLDPWEVTWSRISTPAIPMLLVELEWKELIVGWGWSDPSDPEVSGADIRLRFRFPSDQRKAAVSAAEELRKGFIEIGAVNVTLDPVPTAVTRSRIPQLATTVRLEDKLRLYWQAIGFEPSAEREAALIEMLHELQDAAAAKGIAMGSTGRTAPTLHKVRLKGFLKYPNEVSLDFTQMEGPLHAIVAPNEEGKSLLVQLSGPGVLYGKTPDRGTLDDLSVAKDSFIEVEFSMAGDEYKLTQSADGLNRKGTVSLLKNGKPELGNKSAGGRDEYKKWADKNLLPQSVYDAVICQSGTESVIDLKDGPRVELLLRVLGLEMYEALAEMARKNAAEATGLLAGVRSRIEELGDVDLPVLREAVEQSGHSKRQTEDQLAALCDAVVVKKLEAANVEKERAAYEAQVARRTDLATQVIAMREKRSGVQTRIDVGKELTDQRAGIEKAVADTAALESEIAAKPTQQLEQELSKATSEERQMETEHRAIIKRADALISQEQALSQRLSETDTKLVAARAVVADRDAITAAVTETTEMQSRLKNTRDKETGQRLKAVELSSQLNEVRARQNGNTQKRSELTRKRNEASIAVEGKDDVLGSVAALNNRSKDIETATAEIGRYRQEIDHLQALMTSAASNETKVLRSGHEDIISGVDPIPRSARAIEEADNVSEEASETPDRLIDVKNHLAASEEALKQYQNSLQGHQANAARLPYIEAAEKTLTEAVALLSEVQTESQTLTAESGTIVAKQLELEKEQEQTQTDITFINGEIQRLAPLVSLSESLGKAEVVIQGLEEQIEVIMVDRENVNAALAEVQQEATDLKMVMEDAALNSESIRVEIAVNNTVVCGLKSKIEDLCALANKSTFLTAAISAEETLLHQLSGIDKDLEALEHQHDQLGSLTEPPPAIDLTSYEAAVTKAREYLTDAQSQLAVAEKDLRDAEAKEARRQELKGQVRGLEDKVSNWTLLGQHFGKDALQSEEVSTASGTLTEIVNDLIQAGGDFRHSVSIQTERLSADKKKMIPCLDFRIFDSEEGIEKESKRLSAGGKQLVGTPLGLGLVVLGCQRAGIAAPTIFLDEVANNLDAVNTPRFIGTLRRFAEILQASIIFISQDPEIWALADSRIHIVGGGKLELS